MHIRLIFRSSSYSYSEGSGEDGEGGKRRHRRRRRHRSSDYSDDDSVSYIVASILWFSEMLNNNFYISRCISTLWVGLDDMNILACIISLLFHAASELRISTVFTIFITQQRSGSRGGRRRRRHRRRSYSSDYSTDSRTDGEGRKKKKKKHRRRSYSSYSDSEDGWVYFLFLLLLYWCYLILPMHKVFLEIRDYLRVQATLCG